MSKRSHTLATHLRRLAAIALLCAAPTASYAADSVSTDTSGGYARLLFNLSPAAHGKAALNGNVLTIAFDRPVTVDPAKLQALSSYISNVRLDPDKKTLRLVIAQTVKLHSSVSGASYAVDLAPSSFTATPPDLPPPPKPPGPVDVNTLAALKVRAGVYQNFSRVVFDWPQNVPYSVTRAKDLVTLHFVALAKPDFSPLTRLAPPWVKPGDWHVEANRGIAVTLAVDPSSRTHDFRDGTHVVIDILSPTADATTYTPPADPGKKAVPVKLAAVADTPAPAKPLTQAQVIADTAAKLKGQPAPSDAAKNPQPQAAPAPPPPPPPPPQNDAATQRTRNGATLTFAGYALKGSAVFMRGMTAWIVLDGTPHLDPVAIKNGLGSLPQSVTISNGDGAAILRIALNTPEQIAVQAQGGALKISIAPDAANRAASMEFARSGDPKRATLTTLIAGATHAIRVTDPDVGDSFFAVPGFPGRAVLTPRDNLEFSILTTASGLAVVPHVDDLSVDAANARVVIGRPQGLLLTPPSAQVAGSPAMLVSGRDGPSFMDLGAWKRGPARDFLSSERALTGAVSRRDLNAANPARLQLARFYLANQFAAETLGLIKVIQNSDPSLLSSPHLIVMKAAADYMMGRYRDAHNDLASDTFSSDRHAAFWRTLTEAALHNWNDARDAATLAEAVVNRYPPEWQARLRLAEIDTALASSHIEVADAASAHLPKTLPQELLFDGELAHARLLAAEGRMRDADLLFSAVEKSPDQAAAAQAVYYGTEARLAAGAITRDMAIDTLEKLRFRWRGDSLELATLRKLGQLYFAKNDWRDGLRALRTATQYFPNDDQGRQAQDDMRAAFVNLFLKGKADKIPPIQALSLFYDFIDLTPIGPDGDEMIRRMSDRLVAVDLLGPAADLLKYQVNHRLDGIGRSQVAARLAMIYLMDKKPDQALDTLVSTRMSGLPDDVNHQRMLLEARSLAGLKRWDEALDMVAVDDSPDTTRLRADIYWESGNWAIAGQKAEDILATSWSDPAPLTAQQRNDVMRAAVAYSLANDQTSLDRLRDHFLPKMKSSPDASAFNVVTQKIDAQGLAFRDAAAEIASVDTLKTFLADFKKSGT